MPPDIEEIEEFADISSHQAGTNLAVYAQRGHQRILVKATEGTTYTNPRFAGWWRLAGALCLSRGAYHFARPSSAVTLGRPVEAGGEVEAARFAAVVRAAGGLGERDWVCLDMEDPRERGPRAARHAVAFAFRMMRLGFGRGVVYSYAPYVAGTGLTPGMLPEGWRLLHIANYGSASDSRVPLPPGWGRGLLVARQYSESARQAGIPGGSDANRVVREWLPELIPAAAAEEDDVTEQDIVKIADRVLAELHDQVFAVTPTIKQGGPGQTIGATYNKVGDVQATLAGVEDRIDFVYDQLARLGPALGVELEVPPWRTAPA